MMIEIAAVQFYICTNVIVQFHIFLVTATYLYILFYIASVFLRNLVNQG